MCSELSCEQPFVAKELKGQTLLTSTLFSQSLVKVVRQPELALINEFFTIGGN